MYNHNRLRLTSGMGILLPLCALSYYFAYLLRFDGFLDPEIGHLLLSTLVWVVVVKALALIHSRLHLDYSRYVTFRDMMLLVRTVTISSIGITLLDALLLNYVVIPRSVILLDWGITLGLLAAVRILPRLLSDSNWGMLAPRQGATALIVGANDAGEALLRSILRSNNVAYRPIGFIDERQQVQGRRIAGIPVMGTHADVPALVRDYGVEELLITSGALPGKDVRALVTLASQHGFRVKVLPSYEQILEGSVAINPRPVAIADLLRRPSVELDMESIHHWIDERVVMVTGSAGSIGSEICRQVLRLSPTKLVLVDRSETGQFFLEHELRRLAPEADIKVALADLTDAARTEALFRDFRPQIIFHAAAYKHVPLMEAHVGEAVKNIVLATRILTDLAEAHHAEGLVMISTDKAVNPTSVMGSCKQLAEQYVQSKAATSLCRLVTVRFGNVLDSAGSVVPIFRHQIAKGGPVTVTHPEMIRYFMLIPEAAQLVIQAGAMGRGGEIFVLDMGEPVRIMDLAQDMIRLSGLRVGDDVEIEVTGLRPGEKLFEELYSDRELHQPTQHAKIMSAAGAPREMLEVIHDINRLADVLDEPNEVVRHVLRDIIPLQDTVQPQQTVIAGRKAA